jgi:antirestriction protein
LGGYSGNDAPRNYPSGPVRPEDFQNTYRNTVQSLRQLEQQAQADPNMLKDIQTLMRDLQRLDPYTYANDPLLAERIHAALMSGVEQVEMELRRKVDEAAGNGSVRSPGGETVPQGYADAVAEYFRKLSKSK